MTWSFPELFWARSTGVPAEVLKQLSAPLRPVLEELERAEARLEALDRALFDAGDRKLRRRLRKRRATPGTPERNALLETIRGLEQRLDAAADEVCVQLRAAIERPDLAMLAWLSSRGLAEALAGPWSRALEYPDGPSPKARVLGTSLASGLAAGRSLDRRALLLLQRGALKTELAGAYGPCFWGRIDPELEAVLECEPGASLVQTRRVFFEHWAVRALAARLAAEVAEHCRPRLSASCVLEERTLYYPIGRRAELEEAQARAIRACNGRTAQEIRAALEPDEARALDELVARGVIELSIPLPLVDPAPEQHLLAFVRGLPGDLAARAMWLRELERMIELRDRILGTEDLSARRELDRELDRCFRALAGVEPSRPGAKHARFVIYEDCARDVELRLGARFLEDLEALEPVLDLARWTVLAWAAEYERRVMPLFSRLAAGLDDVDFALFVRETKWVGDSVEIPQRIRGRLAGAWSDHLGERASARDRLELSPDDFAAVLAQLPQLEDTRVPASAIHGLSVMLCGTSVDAINAGDYRLVLHRLHQGVPMLVHPAVAPFCPDRDSVERAFAELLEQPLIQLVDAPSGHHRSNLNLPNVAPVWEALLPGSASRHPSERTAIIGELVVTEEDGHLVVRTRDGRAQSSLLAMRWPLIQSKLLDVSILPAFEGARSPRIEVERWILGRAGWNVPSAEILGTGGRMSAVRALRRTWGLPRHVFVRSASEPSDIYVDLENPTFFRVLGALARAGGGVTFSEAMPDLDALWLEDYSGSHFVCELRLSAFHGLPSQARANLKSFGSRSKARAGR